MASARFDIIRNLLQDIGYSHPSIVRNRGLEDAAKRTVAGWNIGDEACGLEHHIIKGTTLVEYIYPDHPLDLKLLNALVTAFCFWVDDEVEHNVQACQEFQTRFHDRQPQLHPLLDHFGDLLRGIYQYYEPFAADQMVVAALRLPGTCVLEYRSAHSQGFQLSKHAKRYPRFVRDPTAMGEYYAYGAFDRKRHPDVLDYIQTVPELMIFLAHINDLMSANKEEEAGEDHNYISFVSQVHGGKDKLKILHEIAAETAVSHRRVSLMLADLPVHLKTWVRYSVGGIAFHIDSPRYGLPKDIAAESTEQPASSHGGNGLPARAQLPDA